VREARAGLVLARSHRPHLSLAPESSIDWRIDLGLSDIATSMRCMSHTRLTAMLVQESTATGASTTSRGPTR